MDILIKFKCFVLRFFIVSVVFIFCFSCGSVTELPTVESHYREDISFVDADEEDFIFFPDTELQLKTVYNYDSIRIFLKAEDPATMGWLLANGLSVWVDPDVGKNKEYGVTYSGVNIPVIERYRNGGATSHGDNDSLLIDRYNPFKLVEKIKKRGIVLHKGEKTIFANKEQARIYINEFDGLNYVVTLPFTLIGIDNISESISISIGAISRGSVFPQQESSRNAGSSRGGVHSQDRRAPRKSTDGQPVKSKSINSWVVFHILYEN